MFRRLFILLLLGGVLLLPLSAGAQGQEPPTGVRCDATLMTLLLVAIHDYGYQPPLRLEAYDFAQYRPLGEAVTGQTLPVYSTPSGPGVREQTEQGLQAAATELAQGGLGLIGEGLSAIADEAGAIAEAGQEALQTGAQAIQAGVAAVDARDAERSGMLAYGAVPGEPDACTQLRVDLVDFLWNDLRAEQGVQ